MNFTVLSTQPVSHEFVQNLKCGTKIYVVAKNGAHRVNADTGNNGTPRLVGVNALSVTRIEWSTQDFYKMKSRVCVRAGASVTVGRVAGKKRASV